MKKLLTNNSGGRRMYHKMVLLCAAFLPLIFLGCATPATTTPHIKSAAEPVVKEYQAELIIGETTRADITRMLGAPSSLSEDLDSSTWNYSFGFGKATRGKIRLVQADGSQLQYVLEAKPDESGNLSGGGHVAIWIDAKTNRLKSVHITNNSPILN